MILFYIMIFFIGLAAGAGIFGAVVAVKRSRRRDKHEFRHRSMPDLYMEGDVLRDGRSDNSISGFKDKDDG